MALTNREQQLQDEIVTESFVNFVDINIGFVVAGSFETVYYAKGNELDFGGGNPHYHGIFEYIGRNKLRLNHPVQIAGDQGEQQTVLMKEAIAAKRSCSISPPKKSAQRFAHSFWDVSNQISPVRESEPIGPAKRFAETMSHQLQIHCN
ncbi:hypothetical protein MNQ98_23090 [Paenibacillus sp. N3/727]|uniref:hypothetical protein n=1 Tax=Paenibacillus sp. N3/727 TaxID=2925845 RepID=UPI001F537B4F|nr:hypothetical protein [Paenibacillus sp. N3/727]UNK17335.1 hypothetical protein MNQ98_23090 [Paenibacillus sp. N3/727]